MSYIPLQTRKHTNERHRSWLALNRLYRLQKQIEHPMTTNTTLDRTDRLHDEQMVDEGCPNCGDLKTLGSRGTSHVDGTLGSPPTDTDRSSSIRISDRNRGMSDRSLHAVRIAERVLDRSLLQYISQCEPWHTAARDGLVASIQTFASWQRTHCGRLEQLLDTRHLRPDMTAWPTQFPAYNFCNIDYLLPKLIDAQALVVMALDDCLLNTDTDTEARLLIEVIATQEHQILDQLREENSEPVVHNRIATGPPPSATPSPSPFAA
jgi:hypothetical protein